MKYLLLFLLLFITKSIASQSDRTWQIVIENDYERSSEIWGTYKHMSERVLLVNSRSKIFLENTPPSNMVIKNGKIILIRPVNQGHMTSYRVKEFAYKKTKKRKIFG